VLCGVLLQTKTPNNHKHCHVFIAVDFFFNSKLKKRNKINSKKKKHFKLKSQYTHTTHPTHWKQKQRHDLHIEKKSRVLCVGVLRGVLVGGGGGEVGPLPERTKEPCNHSPGRGRGAAKGFADNAIRARGASTGNAIKGSVNCTPSDAASQGRDGRSWAKEANRVEVLRPRFSFQVDCPPGGLEDRKVRLHHLFNFLGIG
jgi:hypothetical protein